LLHARGDYDDAARWFRKIPRDHALGNESLLHAGRCRLALNQCHLAAVAFKSVISNNPKPLERHGALYHLGMAYTSLLDFSKAVAAFEELCIEDPGYQDAAQQLQKAHEQLAAGETMRVAEIPFDVLTAWRNIATHQNPSAQDKSAAA
jgi:tetratricopeptide (TPR) repeat protein